MLSWGQICRVFFLGGGGEPTTAMIQIQTGRVQAGADQDRTVRQSVLGSSGELYQEGYGAPLNTLPLEAALNVTQSQHDGPVQCLNPQHIPGQSLEETNQKH